MCRKCYISASITNVITRSSSCLPWCSGGGREYGHYLCGTLSRACLKWLQLHCPAVPTEGPGLVGSAVHNIKRKRSPHLWILKYCFTFFKVMLEPKKACLKADLALQSPFCDLWHLWFYNVCTCFHFSVFIFCTSSSVEYPRGSRKHAEGFKVQLTNESLLIKRHQWNFCERKMGNLVLPTFSALS